jgi:peptidoglycan/xylan/chitin deacetylase (PgdA/CDA1 family)
MTKTNVAAIIPSKNYAKPKTKPWRNGVRLVVSFSMQLETGGHERVSENPFSLANPIPPEYPDLAAETWFRYGVNEGVHRLLEIWDKYKIKTTAHTIGGFAKTYPDLIRDIHHRGHEIAGHGMYWRAGQYKMTVEEETEFIENNVKAIEDITGERIVGYDAFWMRRSVNTMKILQKLGFIYQVNDLSRDEPFVTHVQGKRFVYLPYTLRNNDIMNIEARGWTADQHLSQLKREFDYLYEEGKTRRRHMSVSFHDRMGGTPAIASVTEEFIRYVQSKEGAVFMRKADIARMVMDDPDTLIDDSELMFNQ